MNVLMLAPQVPWPLTQGTAIRNYHIARELAKRHRLTVAAFGEPPADYRPLTDLGIGVVALPAPPPRSLGLRFRELLTDPTPDLARRLLDESTLQSLQRLCSTSPTGTHDVVQVEGLEMSLYGLAVQRRMRELNVPHRLVYDAHNAEWVLQDRAWRADIRRLRGLPGAGYSLVQTFKLKRYERRLLRAADAVVAVSDADAAALQAVARAAPITVVPNGVDPSSYQPASVEDEEFGLAVFIGKMDFRPNIDAVDWFCRSVWPKVRSTNPQARFAVVGRDPVPRVRALAGKGVEVTGKVDDVNPWLARAQVVVLPLRVGGGTRLKALEAMAMQKAIVATRMAIEGLQLRPHVEVVIADEPAGMAAAIAELFADAPRRRALGRRARERAKADYDWQDLIPRIERLYGHDTERRLSSVSPE